MSLQGDMQTRQTTTNAQVLGDGGEGAGAGEQGATAHGGGSAAVQAGKAPLGTSMGAEPAGATATPLERAARAAALTGGRAAVATYLRLRRGG